MDTIVIGLNYDIYYYVLYFIIEMMLSDLNPSEADRALVAGRNYDHFNFVPFYLIFCQIQDP